MPVLMLDARCSMLDARRVEVKVRGARSPRCSLLMSLLAIRLRKEGERRGRGDGERNGKRERERDDRERDDRDRDSDGRCPGVSGRSGAAR